MSRIIPVIFISILAVLIFSAGSFAQDSTFKVTSFIPERFSDLELKVEGGWNATHISQNRHRTGFWILPTDVEDVYSNNHINEVEFSPYSNYRYWTPGNVIDYGLLINVNYQRYSTTDSQLTSHQYVDTLDEFSDNTTADFGIGVNQDVSYRHYFGSSFHIGSNVSLGLNYSENNIDQYYERYDKNTATALFRTGSTDAFSYIKSYQIALELYPGSGRIYEGFFAARAMYIIKELEQKGFLTNYPNFNQMKEIAEVIYQYDQKHVIDSRIRRIDALGVILDYLSSENIMVTADPKSVLYLQDVWEYFPSDRREFGSRINAGIGLQYLFKRSKSRGNTNSETTRTYYDSTGAIDSVLSNPASNSGRTNHKDISKGLYFFVNYMYAYPFNLKWQGELRVETDYSPYGISEQERNDYDPGYSFWKGSREIDHRYSLEAMLLIKKIISSRSELRFNTNFSYISSKYHHYNIEVSGEKIQTDLTEYTSVEILPSLRYLYRISIPTTFSVTIQYIASHSDSSPRKEANQNGNTNRFWFSIGFTHYIL